MYQLEIGATEKRDRHLKSYVEKSLEDAIKDFQRSMGMYSVSEATRQLIIDGLTVAGYQPKIV